MEPDAISPPPTPAPASRFRAALLMAAIFASGLVAGAAGTVLFVTWRLHHPPPGGLAEGPILRGLTRDLDLDDAQREAVRRILIETRSELATLAEGIEPEVRQTLARAKERVRAELRAPQQERFDREVEKRLERLARLRERWGEASAR